MEISNSHFKTSVFTVHMSKVTHLNVPVIQVSMLGVLSELLSVTDTCQSI